MHGLIVDAVNDIVTIRPDDMQPLPDIGRNGPASSFLDGLATVEDRMVMVLKLDSLTDKITNLDQAA